jgi:hypothetical protein
VFSTAGLTIAKDHARLESDRANELVFLHDCIPSLECYDEALRYFNKPLFGMKLIVVYCDV